MIVKNEAKNIADTLQSAIGTVDRWCILDTGSTDDTKDIIRRVLGDVPGVLHEGLFENYAQARNDVLRLAEEDGDAVFTLMLSGDEVLHGGAALQAFLKDRYHAEDGAYAVEMRSGSEQRWYYPRILRNGERWRYHGAFHEVPIGPEGQTRGPLVLGDVYIIHTVTDIERRKDRDRNEAIPILTRMAEDEDKTLAQREQAIFHLAKTHVAVAMEMPDEIGGPRICHLYTAMGLFFRHGQILSANDGDPDRTVYDLFCYYHVADKAGVFRNEELFERLQVLCESAPKMPEAHYLLAEVASRIDVRKAAFLAVSSAHIARVVKDAPPTHLPTDLRIEWLSYRLAAACSKQLNKATSYVLQLVERGIAAGGPPEEFAEITHEGLS